MFKKCKVVMLPTNQKSNIVLLVKTNQLIYNVNAMRNGVSKTSNQHLYITSDEEIKEGDWIINALSNKIYKANEINIFKVNQYKHNKKIIATTNTLLGLPQPSQQFIEKYIESYNKGNVITDVLVEYDPYGLTYGNFLPPKEIGGLKVNPKDNTITIKKIKDSWNREEVINLLDLILFEKDLNFDKWISENL